MFYDGSVFRGDPYAIFTLIVNLILTFVIIFMERKQTSSTYAWLLFLWIFPYFGFIFYILFSQKFSSHRIYRYREVNKDYKLITAEVKQQAQELEGPLSKESPLYPYRKYRDNIEFQNNVSNALFTTDNAVDVITDGTALFENILSDIKNAQTSINIEFYILKNDAIGKEVIDLLEKKAEEGVQVRIIYDQMGSRTLSYKYILQLREKGAAIAPFLPSKLWLISRYLQLRLNYRDHRKIIVIDGKIGYIGGFNIGDEYIGRSKKFGYWRDSHLRIKGPAVKELQLRFVQDWMTNNAEIKGHPIRENLDLLFPEIAPAGDVALQIVASGPDTINQNIKQGYLKMINDAREHIYITSPYFVIDDSVNEALKIALQSGVKVHILIPSIPDHPFILPTTMSYAGALIPYGAEVYLYQNGFVHAKTMVVDEEQAVVGSCNFDIRSFSLNFECSAFIYNEKVARQLIEAFEKDVQLSEQYTLENYIHRGYLQQFKESVSRLLSPIL